MKKKLTLFPMTRDMCAIARNQSLLQYYVLDRLLVPGFSRLAGEDISEVDGGAVANIKFTEYNSDALDDCDIIFVDYDENIHSMSVYNDVIQNAKEIGKEIVLSRKLRDRLRDKSEDQFDDIPAPNRLNADYLHEISVPVITVLTQGPRTDQFALELALRKYFSSEGYKVAQIGSHEASIFFGFSDLPCFMYESRDGYEKALRFNHYVKELISEEKPDLLILGIPEATLKYNNKLLNGLGFMPFIACSAIRSDLQILSMYRDDYKLSYFDEMYKHGLYRLGVPIRFFNISNTCFAPDMSSEIPKHKYIDLNSNFVLSNIQEDVKQGQYCVFNVLNSESTKDACKAAHELLVGNVSSL